MGEMHTIDAKYKKGDDVTVVNKTWGNYRGVIEEVGQTSGRGAVEYKVRYMRFDGLFSFHFLGDEELFPGPAK